jgi:hypothetical protein
MTILAVLGVASVWGCEQGRLVAWVNDGAPDGAPHCTDAGCVCPEGTVDCGGECVDLDTDPQHCGACPNACEPTQSCVGGACACALGTIDCGGQCVDVSADPFRCGGCDNVCAAQEHCRQGSCACRPGLTDCSGACMDLQTDEGHCGACGNACNAGSEQVCVNGNCLVITCEAHDPPYETCGVAEMSCVDPASMDYHPLHCGECDSPCEVDELCVEGDCRPYYAATPCISCPCAFCGQDLCCSYPGGSALVCVSGVEACPS